MSDDARIRALEARLEDTEDEETRERISDALAEERGVALTGDAHGREGADTTS